MKFSSRQVEDVVIIDIEARSSWAMEMWRSSRLWITM